MRSPEGTSIKDKFFPPLLPSGDGISRTPDGEHAVYLRNASARWNPFLRRVTVYPAIVDTHIEPRSPGTKVVVKGSVDFATTRNAPDSRVTVRGHLKGGGGNLVTKKRAGVLTVHAGERLVVTKGAEEIHLRSSSASDSTNEVTSQSALFELTGGSVNVVTTNVDLFDGSVFLPKKVVRSRVRVASKEKNSIRILYVGPNSRVSTMHSISEVVVVLPKESAGQEDIKVSAVGIIKKWYVVYPGEERQLVDQDMCKILEDRGVSVQELHASLEHTRSPENHLNPREK